MTNYQKKILTIQQQIQAFIDAGMGVSDMVGAKNAMETIGYYRLRGYCFHKYDNSTKKYISGTNLMDVLRLYDFDTELSHLLFSMTSSIEVALRVRLKEALLTYNDPLILNNPSEFVNKLEVCSQKNLDNAFDELYYSVYTRKGRRMQNYYGDTQNLKL